MSLAPDPRADPVLIVAVGLVLGGLLSVAPWEVVVATAAVLALALLTRRISRRVALAAALGIIVGGIRAKCAILQHEAARKSADASLAAPTRCSAHARVSSSPVRVRGTLRWDAELSAVVCPEPVPNWNGRATLYGGPDSLARGDDVDLVATLASPQRFWNGGSGDPRPAAAHRGILRSGGTIDARITREGA